MENMCRVSFEFYMITQVILAFWLVFTYDLLVEFYQYTNANSVIWLAEPLNTISQ